MKSILLLGLSLIISGCASKRDFPERIFDLLEKQAKVITETINEGMSAPQREKKIELPQNFKLAVYFRSPKTSEANWKWSKEDRKSVLTVLEEMEQGKLGRVFELINTGGPEDPRALRLMALQQGADALLLVQGVAEVESDLNPWAATYVALLPMFFVEGNDVTSAFVGQALLWDAKEPFLHLGVQSEGEWSMKRPAVFKQKARAVRKAKEEAMEELIAKLKKNFQEVLL